MRSLVSLAVLLVTSPGLAADLAGRWEVQSMGADREIVVQQKGDAVVAHRVMWPSFEGEKYKLEHLYRGKLKGNKITGELLVKEPELKGFEVLRDFEGTVAANGAVTIDGLPLKRLDEAPVATASTAAPAAQAVTQPASARPSATPTVAQTAAPAAAAPAAPAAEGSGALVASLGPSGEGLFKVSTSVSMPGPAASLTKDGDKLLKNKKWAAALEKFQAADAQGAGNAALWHRLGTCFLYLERYDEAKTQLRRALKLDPQNPILLRDFNRAKMLGE